MPPSLLAQLVTELERQLPLVKVLVDVHEKLPVAQAELTRLLAAKRHAEREAAETRRSADAEGLAVQNELQEKTAKFKAELAVRHAALTEEVDALHKEAKAARLREKEEIRLHKEQLADLRRDIDLAQRELDASAGRLAMAKAEFARALAGVS